MGAQPMILREEDAERDPLLQFVAWFGDAGSAGVGAPEAAALATASAQAGPSARMVLVKRFDERGFVFYTNHASRKARELAENPRAALLFYWAELARQVRIEGPVGRMSEEESAAYVRSRPRLSQLSALASPQSEKIAGRDALERRVAEIGRRYQAELPLPTDWGGFRVTPLSYEFWQQRDDRLHDRLLYQRRDDGSWALARLAP